MMIAVDRIPEYSQMLVASERSAGLPRSNWKGWTARERRQMIGGPPKKEEPMELTTHRRVERTIQECRMLGIEADPRTVAEIMVDDDVTAHRYEDFCPRDRLSRVREGRRPRASPTHRYLAPLVEAEAGLKAGTQ
jgi:hypothetical protein